MKRHNVALVLMAVLVVVWACGEDSPEAPQEPQTIEEVILTGGDFEPVVESRDSTAETTFGQTFGGEKYYCTKRTYDVTKGYADFPLFDPNADVIFPGNLLQGKTLADATPAPIVVKRAPGKIVITVMNGGVVTADVPEMSLSGVFKAANTIVGGLEYVPARTTLNFQKISSREQLELAIGAEFHNMAVDVEGEFAYRRSHAYSKMLVKLVQSYYTIAYELPTSYNEVFASSVTAEQLSKYIGPGNPAAFIGSVTYGRMFYLLFQTRSSSTDLDLRVKAYVRAAAGEGGGSFSLDYLTALDSLTVTGYALGGDAGDAAAALFGSFDDMKHFIEEGDTVTTGVPLSYQVRSLSRPDQIIKSKLATRYDVVDCVPLEKTLENAICWYRADSPQIMPTPVGSRMLLDEIPDYGQNFGMDLKSPAGHYGCEWVDSLSSDLGRSYFRFFRESDLVDGNFAFSGAAPFTDTDYTIVVVARLPDLDVPYPAYFVFGASPYVLENLCVGFWDRNRLALSHRGEDLIAGLRAPYRADEFNVYTFRFSRQDGMSIYAGRDAEPLAADASKTAALVGYPGSKIGAGSGRTVEIAEMQAFGMAVSTAQRLLLYDRLRERYNVP